MALMRIIFVVLALVFTATTARAQAVVDDKQTPAVLPDFHDLKADWWHYFDEADDDFTKRAEEVVDAAAQAAADLPPELRDDGTGAVDRLEANLKAYAEIQANPAPSVAGPVPAVAESYGLDDLLALARETRSFRALVKRDDTALRTADRRQRQAARRYERQIAEYLALKATDRSDPSRTLGIVAEGAAIQLGELRAQRRAALLELRRGRLERLEQLLSEATSRLRITVAEQRDLDGARAAHDEALADARRHLRQIEARTLQSAGNEGGASAQGILDAALAEVALADSLRMLDDAKATLFGLAITEEPDSRAIRAQLQDRRTFVEDLESAVGDWRRTLAGEAPDDVSRRGQLAKVEAMLADIGFVDQLAGQVLADQEGWLRHGISQSLDNAKALLSRIDNGMGGPLFKISETPVTPYGLLRVALILVIAFGISFGFRRALAKISERRAQADNSMLYTLGRLGHYVILIIGLVAALSSVGLDFTNVALVAGALSVGIGFGLQSIVNNFVSGLILLFERSVKVGDFVELDSGIRGQVKEINVRSTLINTNDNVDIIVPNSELVSGRVTNWTLREAIRRVRIPFGVAYGTDKAIVRQAALEAAARVPHTLTGRKTREPQVWLVNFGESSLDFELIVWLRTDAVKRPGAVHAAYLWEIETSLREHGIEIPFPQRDLHLRSGFNPLAATSEPRPIYNDEAPDKHSAR